MLGFTINQLAVLFLVLVLGWLLGLASRSGGRRWRRAYEAEVAAREEDRRRHAAELAERDRRHAVELDARDGRRVEDRAADDRVTPATLDLTRRS